MLEVRHAGGDRPLRGSPVIDDASLDDVVPDPPPGLAVTVIVPVYGDAAATRACFESLARDGCINVPGVAHSSADCSVMTWMDPNTVLPTKPLAEMSGAEENLVRSYNILVRGGQNGVSQRAARAKSIRQ